MISPAAIERYLARKFDNFDWLKRKPIPGSKLWQHQRVALAIMDVYPRFMFHIDMGGGKTRIILESIKARKAQGQTPKVIVFVPFLTAIDTWVEQCHEHTPTLRLEPLLGTTEENRVLLRSGGADIYTACYQSAVALVSGREEVGDSRGASNEKGKSKWRVSPDTVKEHFPGFDTLVMDECQKVKNIHSLTFKMCKTLAQECTYVYGLSGTPFGKDLQDLWPQFYLIDWGDTLGPTLGFFRAVFFAEKRNHWGGFEYKFKARMLPVLKRIIKNCSIRYSVDEFADLPEKQYVQTPVSPSDSVAGYAQQAVANLREALKSKNTGRYKLVESSYLQLRQLSSGFMTFKGEDSERVQIQFSESPKMEALASLVESLPIHSKMVVFHHFVYTNSLISERIHSMGVGHARVYGGSRDPLGELKRFREDPECRILVINSRSGSASLNLQHANYVVFFEQPEGPIDRQQAEMRVWRSGQTERVFIYDLFVNGTYDRRIHTANAAGSDLLKALLDGQVEA